MKRTAFTLIELLVVIAIIAILAAILFPVFAQAKLAAKKAVNISNNKQIDLAALMYTNDYDDHFPLQGGFYSGFGGWDWGDSYDVPYNWQAGYPDQYYQDQASCWANSIQPYLKSWNVYDDPAEKVYTMSWLGYSTATRPMYQSNYSFNGLLTDYSASAIVSSSNVPLIWSPWGPYTMKGEAITSPFLYCNNPNQPCVYVPSTPGCTWDGTNGGYSDMMSAQSWGEDPTSNDFTYTYGEGFAFVDGHVKAKTEGGAHSSQVNPMTPIGTPYTDYHNDPYSGYNQNYYAWDEWKEQNGCHVLLFRPDFDFATWGSPIPSGS